MTNGQAYELVDVHGLIEQARETLCAEWRALSVDRAQDFEGVFGVVTGDESTAAELGLEAIADGAALFAGIVPRAAVAPFLDRAFAHFVANGRAAAEAAHMRSMMSDPLKAVGCIRVLVFANAMASYRVFRVIPRLEMM